MFLSVLMASVECLHLVCKRKVVLSILNASVICVGFSQLVDHYHRHAFHNIIEHTHAKMLVSALERQVSGGDTYDEVVNRQCNLAYASK